MNLDTNAVRTAAQLLAFPSERVIRAHPGRRDDQVAVSYLGKTQVFATPASLELAVLDARSERLAREAAAAPRPAPLLLQALRAGLGLRRARRRALILAGLRLSLMAGAGAGLLLWALQL